MATLRSTRLLPDPVERSRFMDGEDWHLATEVATDLPWGKVAFPLFRRVVVHPDRRPLGGVDDPLLLARLVAEEDSGVVAAVVERAPDDVLTREARVRRRAGALDAG